MYEYTNKNNCLIAFTWWHIFGIFVSPEGGFLYLRRNMSREECNKKFSCDLRSSTSHFVRLQHNWMSIRKFSCVRSNFVLVWTASHTRIFGTTEFPLLPVVDGFSCPRNCGVVVCRDSFCVTLSKTSGVGCSLLASPEIVAEWVGNIIGLGSEITRERERERQQLWKVSLGINNKNQKVRSSSTARYADVFIIN